MDWRIRSGKLHPLMGVQASPTTKKYWILQAFLVWKGKAASKRCRKNGLQGWYEAGFPTDKVGCSNCGRFQQPESDCRIPLQFSSGVITLNAELTFPMIFPDIRSFVLEYRRAVRYWRNLHSRVERSFRSRYSRVLFFLVCFSKI